MVLPALLFAALAAAAEQRPVYPANCSAGLSRQPQYGVEVLQRNPVAGSGSLISRANSSGDAFNFSFNAAWFPAKGGGDGLIVRVVECNVNHHSCEGVAHPEWTNAGALTVLHADLSGTGPPAVAHGPSDTDVFWAGTAPPPHGGSTALWGAADPRCAHRNGTYYLTWDNCTMNCYP